MEGSPKGPRNTSWACKREDKRNFCCALRSPTMSPETKRQRIAGTPWDFAAQGLGLGRRRSGRHPLIPANFTQGFGIGAADGDLGVVGEGEDGFAVAAFDILDRTTCHPPRAVDLRAFNPV